MPTSVANRLVTVLAACVTALAIATLVAAWAYPGGSTVMGAPTPVSHAPSTGVPQALPGSTTSGLQQQMAIMQGIHKRVVQAADADARRALMPEHLIAMQTGMAMLNALPVLDAGDGSLEPVARPMFVDLPATSSIAPMQLELQFMQLLIQMMIDRLPPS